jgi:glycosyltransferase involved in cell wall biosynthesis
MKKVIAFIPAYNEEESIELVIDTIRSKYSNSETEKKGYFLEILVINDGSTDRTEDIVKQKNVTIISHSVNRGLGAATRTAMKKCYDLAADICIKLDADFQHDPDDIEKTIIPILNNETDICWGSRFTGKIEYRMPIERYLGNKFFTFLMNRLTNFKISDAQTGLMAFNRTYLSIFEIIGNYNPPQQLLIDASKKGMRYCEVPVVFHKRKTGKSFVSFRYPFFVLINILRILTIANPLKVFSTLGILGIFFSIIHSVLSHFSKTNSWDMPAFVLDETFRLALWIISIQCFFFGLLADLVIQLKSKH